LIRLLLLLIAFVPGSRFPVPDIDQELIDRTLALVGGQPIMLSDARAALALGLIEPRLRTTAAPIAETTNALINRELILREVQRYAPTPPSEGAVDDRLEQLRKQFPDAVAMNRVLESSGISDVRLRAWVRDDLRIDGYLSQRFASASTPTDAEVEQAYRTAKPQYDKQGQTFDQAVPAIREMLIAARRQELILDWLADLRRRTEVVILQQ
jgi:hypothetical protein